MNKNYLAMKNQARFFAMELQEQNFNKAQSWEEVMENSDMVYRLAKRYGLIKEFKENGIL